MSLRVLIADDQAVIRIGFRMILENEPDISVVGEAADGRAAVRLARSLRPDIVLMDVRMPDMDGIEATRQLAGPGVPDPIAVLVVTTFDLDTYAFGALIAGASGFLLKEVTPPQLVEAVRTVAAGNSVVAPRATRRLIAEYVSRAPVPLDAQALDRLTARERDVLAALATGSANAEIAARMHVSEATVKTHVSRLLAKLGLRSRVQAVILAYRTGLVHPGAPQTSDRPTASGSERV